MADLAAIDPARTVLMVLDMQQMKTTHHRVLRVPDCPACGTAARRPR